MSFKPMKLFVCFALAALFAFVAFGCSAGSKNYAPAPAAEAPAAMEEPAYDGYYAEEGLGTTTDTAGEAQSSSTSNNVARASGGHKVIFDAEISLYTAEFDKDASYIDRRVTTFGGYIANSQRTGRPPETYRDTPRRYELTARIPQAQFDAFITDIQGVGKLINLSKGSQDITSQYIDVQSRVSVLRIQLERLQEILKTTTNLNDIFTLENEIARVRIEIERLTTQQRQWDDLVDYATVTITLEELPLGAPEEIPDGIAQRMGSGFSSTLESLGDFFAELLIFLVAASPVLVVLALILAIVLIIVKSSAKRRAHKRASEPQLPPQAQPQPQAPPQATAPPQAQPPAGKKAKKPVDIPVYYNPPQPPTGDEPPKE